MNAQLFDSNVRQIVFTLVSYIVAVNIYSYTLLWPPGIQYLVMFFIPYISGRSVFQVRTQVGKSISSLIIVI